MKVRPDVAAATRIAQGLRRWYSAAGRGAAHPTHTQIVNPSLCHDVLERLSPSLERHRGCNIIDLNPGVGLWSQHLHDVLQPRRHILAEPNRDAFAAHLTPLLDQPGSRYRWTDKELKDILPDNELLGTGPRMARDEGFWTENPGLLVTVNFPQRKINSGGWMHPESQFLHDFYVSLFGLQSDLFKRGLFRVLAWLPDDNKYILLPRAVSARSKASTRYEAMAHVKEVAGGSESSKSHAHYHRNYVVRAEDMLAMRQAQEASGLVVPGKRIDVTPLPPAVHIHPSVKSWSTTKLGDRPYYLDELLALDSQVKKNYPEAYQIYAPYWISTDKRTPNQKKGINPTVKRWLALYATARSAHATYWKILRIANEQRVIEQDWRLADRHGNSEAFADLKRRYEAQMAAIDKLSAKNAKFVRKAIDDYHAFDVRALSWYRRPYNPLAVRRSDFSGPRNLALIDIEPQPSFRKLFDTDAKWACFDFVLSRLYTAPVKDIHSALEQIVPGVVDEFVATVPSLTDVNKGGWHDLKQLRVRSLPIEILVDIALAYEAWPFRNSEELLWSDAFRV